MRILYFSEPLITDSQHNHSLSVHGWGDLDDQHLENVAIMGAKDCVCTYIYIYIL